MPKLRLQTWTLFKTRMGCSGASAHGEPTVSDSQPSVDTPKHGHMTL
jgi:hypothetical protein